MEAILFYGLAALAVVAAIAVVAQPNPVTSALALIVTLCCLSGIFGLLGSPFIAALQIVVYAGAIMVLFLFVLMLLNVEPERSPSGPRLALVAGALAATLAAQVGWVLLQTDRGTGVAGFHVRTRQMAMILFSPEGRFLYAFEMVGVLILAALVGAIVLSREDLP